MYKNKCSSACFGPGKIPSIKKALFTRLYKGLFFTLLIFQLSATALFSQDVLLNLDFRNSPIRDLLIEIEEQTDYFFMYNGKVVDVNQKVSLNLRETPLENVLLQLFSETDILYEIVGNQIVLKNKLLQQQRTVTGKIVDEEGMPIIGATIVLKGSSKGTISDLNGNFSIEIPEGEQILVFTYVGMQKQEISITDNLRLNVFMESEAEALEEVVVIGYGVQKKVDLTGSVSVIRGESINNSPVIGVDQAMQGRVAGVRITQTSGQPGESVFVRIRGVGTIGDNDPLYIIDGVPTKDGMNIVSPSEIESISILKDAASSAIYGARGANGIVLITTKKGKKGEPRITYNGYFGVQTHGKLIEMANTHEYVETFNEAVENDNAMVTSAILKRKPIPFDPDTMANVNYMKEIFRPAISQGHQLNISGGNDISNYNVSFDYLNQEGIVKASDYQRYKVRTSITTQVKERLKTGININLVNSKRNLITSSGHNYGTVRYAIFRTSAIPIKYDDGEWVDLWEHYKYFGDGYNPVAMLDKYDNVETINRAIGNLYAELDLAKGLVFKSEIGLDAAFGKRKQFWETWGTNNRIGYPGSVDLNDWQSNMMNWVNTLNYNLGIGNHQFNFLLGSEALKNSTTSHYGSDSRYEDQGEIFRYLGVGLNENKYASEGYSAWALLSTFGRAEYNYNNKYLVSANIRHDGSSRFSEDNKFGTFFSGSMGWRLDREDFFEPISQRISLMKIRASAGQLGNQEIGNYPTSSTYGSGYNYVFGGGHTQNIALGYAIVNRGNEAIRWETTTQYDAGMDAGFFKNKLMLTADYYIKITDDMLVAAPVSAIGGSSSPPYVNAGKVRNRGLELELMYQDTRGEWKYSIESNFTTVDNEVLSLGSGQPILGGEIDNGIYAARTAPGQPIGAFYLLEMEGIFQSEAEVFSSAYQGDRVGPGDVKYVNQNNDNVINQDDRVYVGSPIPKFTYGLSFNTSFRNFDFSMFFQGVYGNKIYMQIGKDIEGFYRNLNITKRFVDEHWRPDYPSNTMPRASWYASTNNIIPSTRFLFDGSYLRLKNVQLGYTLPRDLSQKLNIQQCRIYLSSQNLLTFSNYIGMEPELTVSANDASERDLAAGIDWGTYPSSITYMIGLNFTF